MTTPNPRPDSVMQGCTPKYRGWTISFDYGRYTAIGPNYDASYEGEEDGWVDNGEKAESRTIEGLHAEIDEWFDSQTAICPACNGSGFGSQDLAQAYEIDYWEPTP